MALTSHAGSTEANVTLHSLKILTQVNTTTLGIISIPCQLEITAATVGADGNYVLEPNPANPSQLRVDPPRATNVTLSGVAHQWTGGVCSLPGVSTIVDLLLPNVQTLLQTNLTQALADPDGSGPAQAPIAAAFQRSLAKVNIAGPIGDSLGVALTARIHGVVQDADGVGLTADATFAASAVALVLRRERLARLRQPLSWPTPAPPRRAGRRTTWPSAPRSRASTNCSPVRPSVACST